MKKIDLNELKKIELNILCQFRDVCEAQGFRYSLAGGTLLGAVRHKGFIPWDDDIDVIMPRPDYNKFAEYCKNNSVGFGFVCSETDNYNQLFGKIFDKNTILKFESIDNKAKIGVHVDVFPIDGLGDTYEAAIKNLNSSRFLREILVARNWDKFKKSKTRSIIYEPIRVLFYFISRFVNAKKLIKHINKIYENIDFDKSGFAGAIEGSYRNKEVMRKEIFNSYIDIDFENIKFKGMEKYDEYLSNIYGDYMKLPPKEKRISHHDFIAYYKDGGKNEA